MDELSLGISTRPKVAIEEQQIKRLMTAYIERASSVTFSYMDAFIDDPVSRFLEKLASGWVFTADSGLLESPAQTRMKLATLLDEYQRLRESNLAQGITFKQQLEHERIATITRTTEIVNHVRTKQMRGEQLTKDEAWAFSPIRWLIDIWDRRGGTPKGLEGFLEFLNSPYYGLAPSLDISWNLGARLLTRKGLEQVKPGDSMDVDHISSILPYANLLIVDRPMKHIIQDLGLDKKYGTTVCRIGDDEKITGFLDAVDKCTAPYSVRPPFNEGQVDAPG
jgi:hypothetical protein